mmetsp:Transcript_79250/g.124990  ORF Transcript_79250/g.124990 Transcript_79250/m.124990 type:complete len:104 (-) Transcript_79250:495-806(-)
MFGGSTTNEAKLSRVEAQQLHKIPLRQDKYSSVAAHNHPIRRIDREVPTARELAICTPLEAASQTIDQLTDIAVPPKKQQSELRLVYLRASEWALQAFQLWWS